MQKSVAATNYNRSLRCFNNDNKKKKEILISPVRSRTRNEKCPYNRRLPLHNYSLLRGHTGRTSHGLKKKLHRGQRAQFLFDMVNHHLSPVINGSYSLVKPQADFCRRQHCSALYTLVITSARRFHRKELSRTVTLH